MPTTAGRSRGRRGVRSGAPGAVGEHLSKIMMALITGVVVIVFALVMTKPGRVIDAATQHFMLFYAGVFALIGLAASVAVGLVATDRIVMTPGHRVMAQAVHRAVSFGALAFLVIHIVTEILAQRVHVIDSVIPFLSPYRTFYIGLGTISSDLILFIIVTEHFPQTVYRARQGLALAGYPLQLLPGVRIRCHARAARRTGGQAVCGLELRVRDRTDRAGPGGQVPGHFAAAEGADRRASRCRPGRGRPGVLATSPLRTAALRMAQAQLGGTIHLMPATMGTPGAGLGLPGPQPSGRASGRSRLAVILRPAARAERGTGARRGILMGVRGTGLMPLGAPVYGDARPAGTRGYRMPRRTRRSR